MSALTPAERIAVFMGWELYYICPGDGELLRYRKLERSEFDGEVSFYLNEELIDPKTGKSAEKYDSVREHSVSRWPRLDSYDYLRKVEDEVTQRGWLFTYAKTLSLLVYEARNPSDELVLDADTHAALRATPAERTAALVRVIEAMGGAK